MNAAFVSSQLTGNGDGATFRGSAGNRNPIESNGIGTIGQIQFPSTLNFSRSFDGAGYNSTGHSGFVGEIGVVCKLFSCSDLLSKSSGNLRGVRGFGSVRSVGGVGVLGSGCNGVSNDPSILDLRSAVVLTNDTVNSNGVACNRLNRECTVLVNAGCIVSAVNNENIAFGIGNLHVTVITTVNFGDNTGYEVLFSGVGVVLLGSTEIDSVLNRGGNGEGNDLGVLYLRSSVVLTNRTGNNYVVAYNGLITFEFAILLIAKVCAVNNENITQLIGNFQVAIVATVNFGDDTCNKVVVGGVFVVLHLGTHINDVLDGGDNLGELDGVGLGFDYFTASNGSGKGDGCCFIRNLNGELVAIGKGSSGGISECPSDGNVGVCYAYSGESDCCICVKSGFNFDFFYSVSNSVVIGDNNLFKVFKAINAHRNEVRIAIVQNQNTGYICSPVAVICVSFINDCLAGAGVNVINEGNVANGGGEVAYIGAEVRCLVTQLEVQILIGILFKILTLDDNTLNGYESTNIVLQGFTCCELFGDVECGNVFLGLVNNSRGALVGLLHTVLGGNLGSNFNGHTNFNADSTGVGFKIVAIVATLAVQINHKEVVVLIAGGLGVDGNNNTLNNYLGIGCSSHVFLVAPKNVLRNGEVEGLGCGGAVSRLNGSGQNVRDICCGFIRYVYNVVEIILFGDGNLAGFLGKGPSNVIGYGGCACIVKECNFCSYIKVCSGNVLTLVEVEDVICSGIYVVSYFGLVTMNVIEVILQFVQEITRSEGGYTQCQGQQNY